MRSEIPFVKYLLLLNIVSSFQNEKNPCQNYFQQGFLRQYLSCILYSYIEEKGRAYFKLLFNCFFIVVILFGYFQLLRRLIVVKEQLFKLFYLNYEDKQKLPKTSNFREFYGGQRGIRTLDTLLTYTRVPVVRLRPAQPSVQYGASNGT